MAISRTDVTTHHRTTIHDVGEAVCNQFGITMDELRGPKQSHVCAEARTALCHISDDDDEILAGYLGRTCSTVARLRRRANERLEPADVQLLEDVKAVRRILNGEQFNSYMEAG